MGSRREGGRGVGIPAAMSPPYSIREFDMHFGRLKFYRTVKSLGKEKNSTKFQTACEEREGTKV